MNIRLGSALTLPSDFVSQAAAVLGIRGGGKSNLAALIAEGLYDAKQPFVVIDPEGSWYGLRVGPKALQIPIFGGEHADVPLEPGSGRMVARIIAEERLSCIVDTSEMSETAKRSFLADFGEELYRRNRYPLHLILEEADDYLPQKVSGDRARTLRAWETIVRRGRKRGLGCTMVTQRSASIAKDVLTQVDTLFVLRTTSPQDRKAIEGWLEYQGQSEEVLETLSKLEAGECWVWSPFYLKKLERVQLPRRRTFDSGSTPKGGKRPPATLASVDLDKVRAQMAETIERAKQEDPRALRAENAQLKKQVEELQSAAEKKVAAPKSVSVPVFRKGEVARLEAQLAKMEGTHAQLRETTLKLAELVSKAVAEEKKPGWSRNVEAKKLLGALPRVDVQQAQRGVRSTGPVVPDAIGPKTAAAVERVRQGANGDGSVHLSVSAKKLLKVLAMRYPDGVLTGGEMGLLSGLKARGGSYNTAMRLLQDGGYVLRTGSGFQASKLGYEEAGRPAPEGRSPKEILNFWRPKLPQTSVRIVELLVESWPNARGREEIGDTLALVPRGGSWNTALSKLRTAGLIEDLGGGLRASSFLMGGET